MTMRKLVLHYHLFKNAGTSVDTILKDSFGDRWQNIDLPVGGRRRILPAEMAEFILANPQLLAVSSHDVVPPLPIGEFQVFPIVFIRHPIVRARSAYLFEWQKEPGLEEPSGTFADYVREHMPEKGNSVIVNFQVQKLSNTIYQIDPKAKPLRDYEHLERARLFLDSIPFFGIVEHFQQSLVRMHYYLKTHFPQVRVVNRQTNVTQDVNKGIQENLDAIRNELGEELFGEFCNRNKLDMDLYNYATKQFFSVVHPG